MVFPFINEGLARKCKNIIHKSGINCNLAFENSGIYKMTNAQRYKKISKERNRGVVYKLSCKNCKLQGKETSYIGETGRSIEISKKEHL